MKPQIANGNGRARGSRKLMRPWKWVGLLFSLVALIFGPWLPGSVSALGKLAGIVVLANLAFYGLGYLKNRFFWRARNRIVGAFVFVGVFPILLLLGIVALSAFMLLGQLGANYLDSSLNAYVRQLGQISGELSTDLRGDSSIGAFHTAAHRVFEQHAADYPKITAAFLRSKADGMLEQVASAGPAGDDATAMEHPGRGWLGDKRVFEGLVSVKGDLVLASLRPARRLQGYYLLVWAPLDERIQERLIREKSIYAAISSTHGRTVVRMRDRKVIRETDNGLSQIDKEATERLDRLQELRRGDTRRMTTWFTPLEALNYETGKLSTAGMAIYHIPIAALYDAYLNGTHDLGAILLKFLGALCILFVVAELFSFLIGAAISSRITQSVHDMHQGMLAVKQGNLQHHIPATRDDQLGFLARSFNEMTASITSLLEEVSEKKRLEQELEIAREVQATLFPKQLPHPRGLVLFGGCEPARTVSGDYYDFIHEDDSRLHIVVGDISGKGISAALMMANLQAAIRGQIEALRRDGQIHIEEGIADLMRQLNNQIYENSPTEKYATLFAARFDAQERCLSYCNAGHLPPMVLTNGTLRRLETGGTVLGLFPNMTYQAETTVLAPGSLLVIFTDGVTEAINDAGEEFGEERLIEILQQSQSLDPESTYRRIIARLRQWQGDLKQHDDITLILAKVG